MTMRRSAKLFRAVMSGAVLAVFGAACGGGSAGAPGAGGASSGGQAGTSPGGGAAGLPTGAAGAPTGGQPGGGTAGGGTAGGGGAPSLPAGMADSAGGTVTGASGEITVRIAAGALLGRTTFFISSGAVPPSSADYTPIDGADFLIAWTGAGFTAGATIGIHIELPQAAPFARRRAREVIASTTGGVTMTGLKVCPDGSTFTYVNSSSQGNGYDNEAVPVDCKPPAGGGGSAGTSRSGGEGQIAISVVTVNPSAVPTITSQPSPAFMCRLGQIASLSVTATGAEPLSYQWLKNGTPIEGATGSSYSTGFDLSYDGAQYAVVVSDSSGFTVTSDAAALTVLPPAPFEWATPKPLSSPSATGVGAPVVASVGGFPLVVWNDNGTLRNAPGSGRTGTAAPLPPLALPARGQPKLLAVDTVPVAYLVFVDDDGTGNCSAGSGNRLSAVALGASEDGFFPVSHRLALYPPASPATPGGCVDAFTAGLADGNITDTDAADVQLVFALVDATSQQLTTGAAIAHFQLTSTPGQAPQGSWTWTRETDAAPSLQPGCDGPAVLSDGGLATPIQAYAMQSNASMAAILTWESSGNVCSTQLPVRRSAEESTFWYDGVLVMDRAVLPAPVATVDAFGNALIVANRAPDPASASANYEVTAAFQATPKSTWALERLDTPAAPSSVAAVASGARGLYAAWSPNLPAGANAIFAAVRTPDQSTVSDGTWGAVQQISDPGAVSVQGLRLCGFNGVGAQAVYAQATSAGAPLQIAASRWFAGLWRARQVPCSPAAIWAIRPGAVSTRTKPPGARRIPRRRPRSRSRRHPPLTLGSVSAWDRRARPAQRRLSTYQSPTRATEPPAPSRAARTAMSGSRTPPRTSSDGSTPRGRSPSSRWTSHLSASRRAREASSGSVPWAALASSCGRSRLPAWCRGPTTCRARTPVPSPRGRTEMSGTTAATEAYTSWTQ
jgi:hypothetical protein